MLKNLRRRQLRHEAGQALALLAVALPIFFVIALVVVDGSQGFVAKRQMQNAADAASLAAAREVVPALDATCQSSQPCFTGTLANVGAKAGEYAVMNGLSPSDAITAPSGPPCNPSLPVFTPANCALPPCDATRATNCFTWPYPSDTAPGTPRATVEVRLQVTVSTFFTKVARISPNFLKASARAVATASGASTPHCSFPGQPRIADPDHWAPSCRIPGDPAGGLGAVAFTKSPDCSGDPSYTSPPDGASIQMTGAPSNLKALMSNGGIITSGNANKFSDHVALGRYSESSPGVPHCVDLWGSNTSPNFPDVHAITPFADYPVPPPSPAPPATGCNVIGSLSTVTERARSSNVATLTTRARHGLSVGMTVAVAGLSPSQFNRTAVVTAVPDATHFSYANAGANVALASSNGTATYDPDGAFGSGTFTF
ncbi:MAG: pilus assembly protein TadG-related protein, partial [Gaiellaceae bacterium]